MKKLLAVPLALGFAAAPLAASAQPEDRIEMVETRAPMEIALIDADFLRPEDPTRSIFGATTQFLDGQTILIQLELAEPISSLELDALKEAEDQVRFSCDEAILYLANRTYVALAKGCAPSNAAEGETS